MADDDMTASEKVFGTDPASPDGYIYVHDDIVFIVGGEPVAVRSNGTSRELTAAMPKAATGC